LSVLTRNQVEGCILHSVFVHSINALSKLYLISARPPQNGQGFNNITRHHSFISISIVTAPVTINRKSNIITTTNHVINFCFIYSASLLNLSIIFLLILIASCGTRIVTVLSFTDIKNPLTPQSFSSFAISTAFLPFVSILYLTLIVSDRIIGISQSHLQLVH